MALQNGLVPSEWYWKTCLDLLVFSPVNPKQQLLTSLSLASSPTWKSLLVPKVLASPPTVSASRDDRATTSKLPSSISTVRSRLIYLAPGSGRRITRLLSISLLKGSWRLAVVIPS